MEASNKIEGHEIEVFLYAYTMAMIARTIQKDLKKIDDMADMLHRFSIVDAVSDSELENAKKLDFYMELKAINRADESLYKEAHEHIKKAYICLLETNILEAFANIHLILEAKYGSNELELLKKNFRSKLDEVSSDKKET